MHSWTRIAFFVLTCGVLVGVVQAHPGLFGLEGASPELEQAMQFKAELDLEDEAVQRRMESKELILRDVMEGRRTLLEAAHWFKHMNEMPTKHQDRYRKSYPARSAGESACLQVLAWVKCELATMPRSQADALMQKLEKELRTHLDAHDGMVVFPDE